MIIPIPIPIGTKHVARVEGAVWKLVACGRCNESYAYLLQVEATGEVDNLLLSDPAKAPNAVRPRNLSSARKRGVLAAAIV